MFADEPTGALDTRTGLEMVDLLSELNRDGSTLVIITHDRELAAALPRRVECATVSWSTMARRCRRGGMSAATLAPSRLWRPTPRCRLDRAAYAPHARGALRARHRDRIGSMVAVLGISASSQADLLQTIDRLGTNLLTLQAGQSFFGDDSVLPVSTASARVPLRRHRIRVRLHRDRRDRSSQRAVDPDDTSGIGVKAADLGLPKTLSATLGQGRFLTAATQHYRSWCSARWPRTDSESTPSGQPARLHRRPLSHRRRHPRPRHVVQRHRPLGTDRAALRADHVRLDANPSSTYVSADDDRLSAVRGLAPATANPDHPEEVNVSRPSDALEAKAAAKGAFTSLFLGLGAVALLVGGVGIANVMVISVLERRSEIGLRRALGATRRHIAIQFLTESLLLAAAGGIAGAALGRL